MASFSVSQKSKQKQQTETVQKSSGTSFEDIDFVSKLSETLEVSRSEAESRIEDIKDKYDGLVTMDSGAAILAAREEGKELLSEYESSGDFAVENIVPGMNSVDIRVSIEKVFSENQFDGGRVRSCEIRDSTGKTQLTAWNEDCDALDHLSRGDVVKVVNAYTKDEVSDWQRKHYDGIPAIQLGDDAKVIAMKEGEEKEIVEDKNTG